VVTRTKRLNTTALTGREYMDTSYVCELAIALHLLVVTFYKCSVNRISNSEPVYNHSTYGIL
jgi:hypothetical protein